MTNLQRIGKEREKSLELKYRFLEVMDAEKGKGRTASYKRLEAVKVEVLRVLGEWENLLN